VRPVKEWDGCPLGSSWGVELRFVCWWESIQYGLRYGTRRYSNRCTGTKIAVLRPQDGTSYRIPSLIISSTGTVPYLNYKYYHVIIHHETMENSNNYDSSRHSSKYQQSMQDDYYHSYISPSDRPGRAEPPRMHWLWRALDLVTSTNFAVLVTLVVILVVQFRGETVMFHFVSSRQSVTYSQLT
jgi:hypothetical protein